MYVCACLFEREQNKDKKKIIIKIITSWIVEDQDFEKDHRRMGKE